MKNLAHGVLNQAKRHRFSLLPFRLIEQNTTVGTMFLLWQHISNRRMGVAVWAEMIRASKTPESMLQDLYEMELQRILLNMQMSLMHSIAKQAAECAEKMATSNPSSESKHLTHAARLASDRFSMEQAMLPVGTGLSHELTWDGPGTW